MSDTFADCRVCDVQLNARHTTARTELTETAAHRIVDLNWADTQLYKHFTQKFSLLVNAFGNEKMDREVNELQKRTNQWFDYCVGSSQNNQTNDTTTETTTNAITNAHTNSNNQAVVNTKKPMIIRLVNKQLENTTCWLLTAQEMDFTKFLRMRQMKDFPGSVFKDNKIYVKERLKISETRRKQILKSKLAMISPKYRPIICKRMDCSEPTTTTDSSDRLVNALKHFTFKQS